MTSMHVMEFCLIMNLLEEGKHLFLEKFLEGYQE